MKCLWDLFFSFFKIGSFTFGGGLAMLPVIRRVAVEEKGWMTEDEIVDCFAICQSLPGVLSINAAIYIGNKTKGISGSIASSLGVILPAFISILVIVMFLGRIENNPYVKGALEGIKAASVGLILVAAYQMARQVLKGRLAYAIAAASFAVIILAGINAMWVILFGGIVGFLEYQYRMRMNRRKGGTE